MTFESPLGACPIFWIPESMQQLEDYCMELGKNDRVLALTIMAFTINMCAKAVDDAIQAQAEAEDVATYTAMSNSINSEK